nr:MAG: hypothetical protein J07AB56_00760 [Candidatus Nanosalinarum sp. J07AB56]
MLLLAAGLVLTGGAAGIQPSEVDNVTLRVELNASEVFRSGLQTTPGEYQPSDYPYLSSGKPEALIPYGDTEELTNIYMPDGLVAYYPLDETAGSTAKDVTTALPDNDGQVVGADQSTTGNVSTAYSFDGTDDSVVVGESVNPDTVTVSAWVKPGSNNANKGIVTSLGDTGDAPQYGLVTDGSGFGFEVANGASSEITTTSSFSSGEWYHLAGTFDGTRASIYLDASRRDQDSIGGSIPETRSDLEIAAPTPAVHRTSTDYR